MSPPGLKRPPRAERAAQGEDGEADRPHSRLLARVPIDFEEKWIAEKCQERANVGEREQTIRRDAVESVAEPFLQKRTRRRQREVRHADGRTEQHQYLKERRMFVAGW